LRLTSILNDGIDTTTKNKPVTSEGIGRNFSAREQNDVHGSMISVTVVRVTPDLSMARIHVSIFPVIIKRSIERNRIANPRIRGILGRRIGKQMRVVPELEFYIDDSLDYIENIDRLLKS
jgi:ribosome-binding factor A